MGLSILEKVGLQKQAATLKGELKAGTLSILDKLAKQRELAAIMAKLKGDTAKPEPAEVDEEGSDEEAEKEASRSVQGFDLGAVAHPDWATAATKGDNARRMSADVVLSNDAVKVAVLLPAGDRTKPTKNGDLKLAWPSEDGFSVYPADDAWAGYKSHLGPKLRKKVRRMVEQAVKVVNDAFQSGQDGFEITPARGVMNGDEVKLIKDGKIGQGETVTLAYEAWQAAGDGLGSVAELIQSGDSAEAYSKLYDVLGPIHSRLNQRKKNPLSPGEITTFTSRLQQILAMPGVSTLKTPDTITPFIQGMLEQLRDLQGATKPAAGNSLVGLFLSGVKHPAWTKAHEKRVLANAIVSNDQAALVVLWAAQFGSDPKAFFIGQNATTVLADKALNGVGGIPDADLPLAQSMLSEAKKAADVALKNGAGGYSIKPWQFEEVQLGDSTGTVFKTAGARYTGAPALSNAYAKMRYEHDDNAISALVNEGEAGAALEVLRREITGMEKFGAKPKSMEWFEGEISHFSDFDQALLSGEIAVERARMVALTAGPESEPVAEDSLAVRYLRGDFNQESPLDFRKRILAVAGEGMELDGLKKGVTNWIEANPDLIAA